MMKTCDENIRKTLELVDRMTEIADEGDMAREDSGCGVLYGVLRDSAYKIKKLAEEEREAHIRKGWWGKTERDVPPSADAADVLGRTDGTGGTVRERASTGR